MSIATARPRFLTLAALVAASTLALSGCTSTTESGTESTTTADTSAATRTVTDSEGTEVAVAADPQRVVTLHFASTEAALDLGITPVGQGGYTPGLLPAEMEQEISDVPVVNGSDGVELEAIAALEPDLILAPNMTGPTDIEQLREIAPTYVYTHSGAERSNWRGRVEEIADALNRSGEAAALGQALETRQEELAARYSDQLAGIRFGVINSYNEQEVSLNSDQSMLGNILMPVGVRWSPQENAAVGGAEGGEESISLEELDNAVGDADVLLYGTDLRPEPNDNLRAVMDSPIYQNLPAVRSGRDYPIGKMTVAGYTDAGFTLDMLEELMADLAARG